MPRKSKSFLQGLGPGLISGAADNDPSGISTYSIAGASLGYAPLWTALLSFPLMAAIQLICGRLGMVTGRGLGAIIRKHYPRWVLWGCCMLLLAANLANIAADLAGMAQVTNMMVGGKDLMWLPLYTVLIVAMMIWWKYETIAKVFKWLTLVFLAYIVAAFLSHPDWKQVLLHSFVPIMSWSGPTWQTLVAILGTTISPYLFFWQAAQEVEEERAAGRVTIKERQGATPDELRVARNDIFTGMLFSNVIMYFIILTAAATLHAHGKTEITTVKDAAEALRPVAGVAAYALFALGVIGGGMLGVPVLAGSCAYAITEATGTRGSLADKPWTSRYFYGIIALSMFAGLALSLSHVDAVKLLYWSAIFNGLLAPPLVVVAVMLSSDVKVMGKHVNSKLLKSLGWACAAVMAIADVLMFVAPGG